MAKSLCALRLLGVVALPALVTGFGYPKLFQCEETATWKTTWSDEQKAWCCIYEAKGCPTTLTTTTTTITETHTTSTLTSSTSTHTTATSTTVTSSTATSTTVTTATKTKTTTSTVTSTYPEEVVTPEKACKRTCLADGVEATCAERIRWVSQNKMAGEVNPCEAARVVVVFDCIGAGADSEDDSEDVCGGCTAEWAMCGLSDEEIEEKEEERRRNKGKKPEVQTTVAPAQPAVQPAVQAPVIPEPAAPAQAAAPGDILPPTPEEIRQVQVPVVGRVQPPVNAKGQLPGTSADLGSELEDLDLNLLVDRAEETQHPDSEVERAVPEALRQALLGGLAAFIVSFVALRVRAARRTAAAAPLIDVEALPEALAE